MFVKELVPDLVLHRGTIHTMDARRSVVPALAIQDGRVVEGRVL